MTTLTIGGETVELTADRYGLVGHIDIDGVRHVVHATVTPTSRRLSPAKWCARA